MEWYEKLENHFTRLNLLEEGQFKVYYELLIDNQEEGLKASEITERVGLNRSYVYSVLAVLTDKGLILSHPGKPKRYKASEPSRFVKELIFKNQTYLDELKEFLAFIESEIRPELEKQRRISALPLKKTFFLDSLFVLKSQIIELLPNCTYRILLHAPTTFYEAIEIPLIEAVEKVLNLKEHYTKIFLISNDSKDLPFSSKTLEQFFIRSSSLTHSITIVLDNTTFVFNVRPEAHGILGLGMVIEDRNIADSYAHQLEHMFKEELYKILPKPNLENFPDYMKNDSSFSKVLSLLFHEMEWHMVPQGSSLEEGYLELVAPEIQYIHALREAGLLYVPIGDIPVEELITQVFEGTKQIMLKELAAEEHYIQIIQQEGEQIIDGFECRTLSSSISMTEHRKKFERLREGPNEKLFPDEEFLKSNPGQMVVFNYFDRAVIMIWAVLGSNVRKITQLLKTTE